MNGKTAKTLAVVVASIMAASLTAGCGNNGGSSSSGQSSTAASAGSSVVSADSSVSNPFSSAESTDTSTETASTVSEPQSSAESQPEPSAVESSEETSTIVEISNPPSAPGKLSESIKTLAENSDKASMGLNGTDGKGNDIIYIELNDGTPEGEAVVIVGTNSSPNFSKSIYGPVSNQTQGTTPDGKITASATVTDKVSGEKETVTVTTDSATTIYTVTLASGGSFTAAEMEKTTLPYIAKTLSDYANGLTGPEILIDDIDTSLSDDDDDKDDEDLTSLPSGLLDDPDISDDMDDPEDLTGIDEVSDFTGLTSEEIEDLVF